MNNKYQIIIVLFLIISTMSFDVTHSVDRYKVAVIDSGITHNQLKDTKLCTKYGGEVIDERKHGQYIYDIVSRNMKSNQCAYIFKVFNNKNEKNIKLMNRIVESIDRSIALGVDVINMSYAGYGYYENEVMAIRRALDAGIRIVVASGNNGRNLDEGCLVYPACYSKMLNNKNFIVVGSSNYTQGNRGKIVDMYVSGKYKGKVGTSFSAAYVTEQLVRTNI